MATAAKTRLSVEDIKPGIGSRILNSKEELLRGENAEELRDLLEQRGVLVFPQVNFTDEEQVAFTKTLGTFAPEMTDKGGEDKVHPITLDEKVNPSSAIYLKGSLFWHIDGTMNQMPIRASLLRCVVPSPKGTGNTGVANTYAAYDALPEDKKAEFDGYRVRHGAWPTLMYWNPEPNQELLERMQSIGDVEIPLVWNHESGRKSLVIGNTAHTIVGKDHFESVRILNWLREWATQEQFVYSHEWSVGDMIIWDNTGTMHRAEAYDPATGRMMVRTKLEGEEPLV
ncbi:TauD/TfdA family dioxygenase [Novosphingobium sp. PS1R-30]|uniref:TauD/TfdA family dioxygenase n=1 Tax=Novosphingobium anseongense TaxID=3133436 RepID=A0ABU8RT89_9SPHN|nr:MAG: TauD/TfdA family dioxygenase [Novosphingobium sp.]